MGRSWATYLAALGCAALFYSFYLGGLAWVVLLAALLLPVFSLAVSLPWMLGVRAGLQVPAKVLRGGGAPLELTLAAGRPLRLRARVALLDLTGQTRQKRTLRPGKPLPLDTRHCALLSVEVQWVRAYDMLGLFWVSVNRPPAATLAVLPAPVWRGEKPPLPRPGEAAALRPKPGGGLAEEHDVRPYRPGDPVNAIHWKLTAKADAPMVREPMEAKKLRAAVRLSGGSRAQYDKSLEELCWLSDALLEAGVPYTLLWDGGSAAVTSRAGLEQTLRHLLAGPVPGRCNTACTADWQVHLGEAPT